MNATIYDIAREAGVSPMTVSRVLKGEHKGLRADARERARKIQETAKRLGYRPSAIAKALKVGNTRTIGVVIGEIGSPYFAGIADAALDEADHLGYQVLLSITKWDSEKEAKCIESLMSGRVDAIVSYITLEANSAIRGELLERRFPLAVVGRPDAKFPSFLTDMEEAMTDAGRYLKAKGYQEFGFIIPDPCPSMERQNFLDACGSCGLKPVIVPYDATDAEKTQKAIAEICARKTGNILAQTPITAQQVLKYIKASCPDYRPDIIFMAESDAQIFFPPLNTGLIVSSGAAKMRTAVNWMINKLENNETPEKTLIKIPSAFVSYESVADQLIKKEQDLEQEIIP